MKRRPSTVIKTIADSAHARMHHASRYLSHLLTCIQADFCSGHRFSDSHFLRWAATGNQ